MISHHKACETATLSAMDQFTRKHDPFLTSMFSRYIEICGSIFIEIL